MPQVTPQEEQLKPAEPRAPEGQPLRASNPKQALALISARVKAQSRRLGMYKLIEDNYDRLPPPDDDPAYGQSAVRVNWGGMKAGVDEGALTDHNLATQPDTYVKLSTHSVENGITARLREIELADKRVLEAWDGFIPELEKMTLNRRLHGFGIFHFPKPNGWHFKSVHPRDLIYPADATFNLGDWEWFALKTEFNITDLLMYIREGDTSTNVGYDVTEIKKLIAKTKADGDAKLGDVDHIDEHLGDIYFAQRYGNKIPGYQFFVTEFDGAVSEYHLVSDETIGFLYKGEKRHKAMGEAIRLLPLGLGKGYLKDARGYGLEMMAHHDVADLVRNRGIESYLNSGAVLQGSGDDDMQRLAFEMKDYGHYKVLPTGITMAQTQFPDTSRSGMIILSDIERSANTRNRAFGGQDNSQRTNEMTATQSRLLAQSNQGAETNEVSRFMLQLTGVHKLRFNRTWNVDKDAPGGREVEVERKLLKEKGVTDADFKAISEVKARRTFGDGNPRNQFFALADLNPYYGRWPEDGKKLFDYTLACAALGDHDLAREVTGYGKLVDETAVENRWRAQMENNTFETSDTAVPLGPKDNHLIHLHEVTVFAEEVVKRVEIQAVSEADAFARINRAKVHAQLHLQEFSQDEKSLEAFRMFVQRWAVLENELRKLGQHLQEQQQANQQKQLEEIRNPRPSVKDQEESMTADLKRKLLEDEHSHKLALLDKEHEAAMRKLQREDAVAASQAMRGKVGLYGAPTSP